MKKLMNVSLFYRYLLSYLVVLFIPMMIVGYVIYSHFIVIMANQITATNQKMLNQMMNIIDIKMGEIRDISFQISSRSDLTPYYLQNFANVR